MNCIVGGFFVGVFVFVVFVLGCVFYEIICCLVVIELIVSVNDGKENSKIKLWIYFVGFGFVFFLVIFIFVLVIVYFCYK